ncbi:MAG TPA: sigma-70 family RNA polymerase sigma factor [Armatimonadota bacterium]|jgi:RNA polymerase sigma-70 factor (ECF subfamily)
MTGELAPAMHAMATTRVTEDDYQESRWIVRARIGDDAAFTYLLSRYRARAVRLATQVLRRPDEAEDAAQEAFIRAFKGIRAFRGDSRFSTWFFHIVLRVCLDRRRLKRWDAEIQWDDTLPLSSPPDKADTRIVVRELLDRLSPALRAALVLRELEGLEYEEIAEALGIPVGTVRSRLNAARGRFREMWAKVTEETDEMDGPPV